MSREIPKSAQDRLGQWLSEWRNRVVREELRAPYLDLACGDNRLARQLPGGFGADVIDHGGADLLVDDFASLPFRSESFATLSIVASLNYFDRPDRVLAECARLLDPQGRLILTLLNPLVGGLWHLLREPWARRPGFSLRQLEGIARDASLRVVRRRRFMLGLANLYELGWLPRRVLELAWTRIAKRFIDTHDQRYAEANPYYYNVCGIIAEHFPDAHFLFVVRSPRSFVVSHIDWERQRWQSALANRLVPFWQPVAYPRQLLGLLDRYHQRVDFYSRVWQRRNAAILRCLEGRERVRTLRFEEVFDPERGPPLLEELLDWLGVERSRSVAPEAVARRENVSQPSGRDAWDEECSRIVERNCGDLMRRLGYAE